MKFRFAVENISYTYYNLYESIKYLFVLNEIWAGGNTMQLERDEMEKAIIECLKDGDIHKTSDIKAWIYQEYGAVYKENYTPNCFNNTLGDLKKKHKIKPVGYAEYKIIMVTDEKINNEKVTENELEKIKDEILFWANEQGEFLSRKVSEIKLLDLLEDRDFENARRIMKLMKSLKEFNFI